MLWNDHCETLPRKQMLRTNRFWDTIRNLAMGCVSNCVESISSSQSSAELVHEILPESD